jgi:hypothetical protein
VTFNAAHLTKAPSLRNTFANSRLNNSIVNDREKLNSVDASYIFDPKTESPTYSLLCIAKKCNSNFFFLCRRDFDDGAGYLSTDAL